MPTVRAFVASDVAEPLPSTATGGPKFAPSMLNCTVPVGVLPVDVMVAVKVTVSPDFDGFDDELIATDVAALLTVCVMSVELGRKVASPVYSAVMVWAPALMAVVGREVAEPLPFSATGAPKLVPSILNCTVPVGVPDPEVTVAVNVTLWP